MLQPKWLSSWIIVLLLAIVLATTQPQRVAGSDAPDIYCLIRFEAHHCNSDSFCPAKENCRGMNVWPNSFCQMQAFTGNNFGFGNLQAFFLAKEACRNSSDAIIYRSPRPQARHVTASTQIAIRYQGDTPQLDQFSKAFGVSGARSGAHDGQLRLANDGRTIVFVPEQPFTAGERVTVTLPGDRYHFDVAEQPAPAADLHSYQRAPDSTDERSGRYRTAPDTLPELNVLVNTPGVADGYLFATPFTINWSTGEFPVTTPYLLIFDNTGEVVFYQPMPALVYDFKKHEDGRLSYFDSYSGVINMLDNTYQIVDSYQAIGYPTDPHEFLLLPNGNVIVMIYDRQILDMSQIVENGDPEAIVVGLVLQEIEPAQNVVFEWRSWDHIPISDSHVDLTTPVVDYIHGNSIAVDQDGHWLISSRHTSEVTKISRTTGDVIWRMGGKGNQFTFVPADGEPFIQQHDARRLPNGNLSIFDNRIDPEEDARIVAYRVDERSKVAYRVWQYSEFKGPAIAMGNAHLLPNGNTLIGWGTMYPSSTEVTKDGQVVWQMEYARFEGENITENSYRAFRHPWQATPIWPPRLLVDNGDLYFSWNGATDVAQYNIYGGATATDMRLLASVDASGFETSWSIAGENECFYQVEPVDKTNARRQRSNIAIAAGCEGARLFVPLFSVP